MIEIKDVTKLYPSNEAAGGGKGDASSIHALDHISVHVAKGEWLSIMGPSGSGKSTLVNLIGCLDRPSSGEIWLDGQNVAGISSGDLNRVRAEKIGFIFQQFHLIPFLTALENVMLAQYFHSMTDEKEAVEALARVGLVDRAHHLPSPRRRPGLKQKAIESKAFVAQRITLIDADDRGRQALDVFDSGEPRPGQRIADVERFNAITHGATIIVQVQQDSVVLGG